MKKWWRGNGGELSGLFARRNNYSWVTCGIPYRPYEHRRRWTRWSPKEAVTDQKFKRMQKILVDDRSMKLLKIDDTRRISKDNIEQFAHDAPDAPCHKWMKTKANFHELVFEFLARPPYSPDLTPSNSFLFPGLKVMPAWKKFNDNEEVIAET